MRERCPISTRATLTWPSRPWKVSATRASGHSPRGLFWPTTSTMSPTRRFRRFCRHFCLAASEGSHSLVQRCQKCLKSSWTRRHRRRGLNAISSTVRGANSPPICPCREWLGVSGVASAGCADWYVSGREFNSASAPMKLVMSSTSLTSAFLRMAFRDRFALLTRLSCAPPKWGAAGGLNRHRMPFSEVLCRIVSWLRAFTRSLSSLSAPTKFVPLSVVTSSGSPRRLGIRKKAFRNPSVLRSYAWFWRKARQNFPTFVSIV